MGEEIILTEVGKAYNNVPVVNDVSLTVRPGEFVTLLGASGSGKTTLLRMIAGFIAPDHGVIEIGGEDVTRTPAHARDIGMVFQNYALFPHLNVYKNIAFPLEMRHVPRAERNKMVAASLKLVKLDGYAERLPRQMSGGQQQRVAFARATVFHPSILLMDEPLGALDRNLREELQLEILRLSRELSLTVVYVTHDQSEAFSMSDRIALLAAGSIVQCSTPDEMYTQPVSTAVARFVGEANVFRLAPGPTGDGILPPPENLDLTGTSRVIPQLAQKDGAVVVRPAAMWLKPDEPTAHQSGSGGGHLRGLVTSIIFGGDEYRVTVDVGAGHTVLIRTPRQALDGIQVGDHARVGWRAEDAVVTRLL